MLHNVAGLGLIALLSIGSLSPLAADILVADDVNTFGTFLAGPNEIRFATNVANFLTAGHLTKNLLLFEAAPGDGTRDYAASVLNALSTAGYNVTVTTNYATPLTGFDAVFVAEQFPAINFVDNNALIHFANSGGGVYLVGGVGPNAAAEAAGWSAFLNEYGLGLASVYNGFSNFPITSASPIFAGVTSLNVGNGQSIIDFGTNPNADIVQNFAGQNVVAVVHVPVGASVPEPFSLALLASVVVLILPRLRAFAGVPRPRL